MKKTILISGMLLLAISLFTTRPTLAAASEKINTSPKLISSVPFSGVVSSIPSVSAIKSPSSAPLLKPFNDDQWVTLGDNIYNTNYGNVGVGTTNPLERLDVAGNIRLVDGKLYLGAQEYLDKNKLFLTSDAIMEFGNGAYLHQEQDYFGFSGVSNWAFTSGGSKIGIGTTTPSAHLTIKGNTNTEGLRIISSDYSPLVIRNTSDTIDLFRVDQDGNANLAGGLITGDNIAVTGDITAGGIGSSNEGGSGSSFNIRAAYGTGVKGGDVSILGGDSSIGQRGNVLLAATFGNVGIGTTNPTYKLHLSSGNTPAFRIDGSSANYYFQVSQYADTYIKSANNSTPLLTVEGTGTADLLNLKDNGTTIFTVRDGGNVGIGVTNPRGKLEVVNGVLPSGAGDKAGDLTVVGVTRIFNQNWGNIIVQTNDMLVQDAGGSIGFGGVINDTGAVYATFAGIKAGKDNAISGQNGGYLTFGTRANGANVSERMRITSTGNVGINTTNPDANLRVNGTLKANYYIAYNGQYGLTTTVKVKGNNKQDCDLNFTNGLMTSTNCPTNGNNSSANHN